ncbi:shikimate dehydrogenase [Erythrobacter sp. KY5]|uniref:shikimate dehydrogenase n=1 Tax=Erythrobacter sp. KY5 TaxID=2011159 RepID=UPI000DBEF810|nr:shikimate dehydrogenase [Erythrobacter sp. KY5]AWW73215.1 shikimate dehydrogenase [Erythrobacter sp. KY5]
MTAPPPLAQVIGDPIAQSKSPLIHRFWLEKLGLPGDYTAEHVTADGVAEYLEASRTQPGWAGCNVTMPHKQSIIPLLDALDPVAEKLGAVNTVVRSENGSLTGYNTDAGGFLEPLSEELANNHLFRMARIIGTGGAARAIIANLADQGFTLVVAGRDPAKARRLLDELAPHGEHHAIDISHFSDPTDFAFDDREGCMDLIVNASPLGMTGNAPLPFDLTHAPPRSIVYDIVTSPVETPLLKNARRAGFRTIGGLSMLIGQADIAFEKFYGERPPRDCDPALMELLSQ